MSEIQNIVAQTQEHEKQNEKKGLHIATYVIPWWVVIVALIILVYLAVDNNMLDFICNPKKEISFGPKMQTMPLPPLMQTSNMGQSGQIPQNLKNLFA